MTAQQKIEPATLASAMATAFAKIEAAIKTNDNAAFKQGGRVSKYADLGAVIDAIKPALIEQGLWFTQKTAPCEDGVSVETVLIHASGEQMSLGTLYVPANKRDAQGFGSALTYARRYSLMTAFGVPAEDDDGNAASRSAPVKLGIVDDNQWATLVQLCDAARVSADRLSKFFQVDNLKALPAARFEEAVEKLNATIAANAEKAKAKEPVQ